MKLAYLWVLLSLALSGCSTLSHQAALKSPKSQPELLAVDHGRLEYYQLGKGSPIVLITGYGADLSSWDRPFIEALSQKHQVIVFNNRNIGRSQVHSTRYDTRALATDTAQLIQNLHLKNPAVLGISMGGMIAQHLAVLYPKRVKQLILINTIIAGNEGVRPQKNTEEKLMHMPASPLKQYFFALDLFFPPEEKWSMGIALMTERFFPYGYTKADVSAVLPAQRELVMHWLRDEKTAEKIEKICMPVLILNGKRDAVIPSINSKILAEKIPHASLQQWKNGGHAMIYQYPDELAEKINQFISKK